MGKKSPKTPAAPDPQQTAAAQAAANKDTAIAQALLNMVDVYSPYGSSTYTQISGAPTSASGLRNKLADKVQITPARPIGQATTAAKPATPNYGLYGPSGFPAPTRGALPSAVQQPAPVNATTIGSTYSDIPRFRQDIKLSPEQQAQLERENAMTAKFQGIAGNQLDQIATALSSPFTLNGINQVNRGKVQSTVGANDFSSDRQRIEDELYKRQLRTLDPEWEKKKTAFDTRMANQGIELGSQAYNDALSLFERGQNDAYDLARNSSIMAGGDEQSRLFGMDVTKGNFANSAQAQDYGQQLGLRQQGIQERVLERTQPIQEIAALLGQGSGVQLPQFGSAPQTGIAPVDIAGLTQSNYANQLNAANQRQANNAATTQSALGTAANLAFKFSDVRVKENIRFVGREGQFPVYHFNYTYDPYKRTYKGVMAQDVAEIMPQAVVIDPATTLMTVNYEMIGMEMQEVLH